MRPRHFTAPFTFFFLVVPYGASNGFVTIALPFALTRAGFSVAQAGAIAALGISANVWLFLWGPLADLTLTPRRWYMIGLVGAAATLFALGFIPFEHRFAALLTLMVFISQLAATLIVLPLGALMAHTVPMEAKGRAAGWYQAGNLGGNGLAGGAGIWLSAHFSAEYAVGAIGLGMILCALALPFTADTHIVSPNETLAGRLRLLGTDLFAMIKSPLPLLTLVLIASPISAGAMSNLWSAVGPDWRANTDIIALVNGLLNGVVSAVGCVVGGWLVDRFGRWSIYFAFGAALAFVAILLAVIARTPATYIFGVLLYALVTGGGYATYSALVVHAIGHGVASTKFAICQSIGNIPVAYMTALDGVVHDRYGAPAMLMNEAILALVCIAAGIAVLRRIQRVGINQETVPAVL